MSLSVHNWEAWSWDSWQPMANPSKTAFKILKRREKKILGNQSMRQQYPKSPCSQLHSKWCHDCAPTLDQFLQKNFLFTTINFYWAYADKHANLNIITLIKPITLLTFSCKNFIFWTYFLDIFYAPLSHLFWKTDRRRTNKLSMDPFGIHAIVPLNIKVFHWIVS